MSRRLPLTGARVLITGAGSGIGRRMALGAAERGADVVIWDLNAEAAGRVALEITAAGGSASAAALDVTDSTAVGAEALAAGPIDVLINNAGVVTGKRLLEASEAQIRRTFEVNALALYTSFDRSRVTSVHAALFDAVVYAAKRGPDDAPSLAERLHQRVVDRNLLDPRDPHLTVVTP